MTRLHEPAEYLPGPPKSARRGRSRKRRRRLRFLAFLFCICLFQSGYLLGCMMQSFFSPESGSGASPMVTVPVNTKSQSASQSSSKADTDDWRLLLVSSEHPLPESYAIPERTSLRNGHSVDSRIYPALQEMMDACRAEGLNPLICSSYRARKTQEALFAKKQQALESQGYSPEEADAETAKWIARPGTSEHETGLALDIVDESNQILDDQQADTAVQKWLMAHCAEYGFILRYPAEKEAITGIGYEPWHYRYVGREAAKEITERGICLEEYLA